MVKLVLIPLFRSFIFTQGGTKMHELLDSLSFNPFIQVFYFYYMNKWKEESEYKEEVLIPLFRSFIFTGKETVQKSICW